MATAVIELCNPDLLAIRPNLGARAALDILRRARLRAAPVVLDNGRAVGVLAIADLTGDLGKSYVADKMSAPTVTADADDPVVVAAALMVTHALHHLVVTRSGVTVGFVSALDIVAALLRDPTQRLPATTPEHGAL